MPQSSAVLAEPAAGGEPSAGSDFAPLLRQVREQGLLERRRGWYAAGITVNLLALAAIAAGLVLLDGSWWTLLLAPLAAVFWARTAFIGHDSGHSQI
ncbi:delta-6 fatty acid desaturase, partial [Streptomyces varsoviensis]